jgi:hypothetical protein
MFLLILLVYFIQLLAVNIILFIGEYKYKKDYLIDLIPFGWIKYFVKFYKELK